MSLEKNRQTIQNLKKIHEESLILNPTENIPFTSENVDLNFLEGMYIPEETRDQNSKVIFGGRKNLNELYDLWCEYMKAEAVTFKPHSGLDAHISLFMSLGQIGEKVLLLPEEAGGHFSTHKILTRLGFNVHSFLTDTQHYKIDIPHSMEIIKSWKPNYIFVDRSEGLYYEDFSWIREIPCIKIFDASQYLANIMAKDYVNPFDMGFDLILTSLHKNYPGPQKAAIFFQKKNKLWKQVMNGMSIYISNIHPKDICNLLLNLPSELCLKNYSQKMLSTTRLLEEILLKNSVPVIRRDFDNIWTQHLWIRPESQEKTYQFFRRLEELHLLTNYRLLPYDLGYGIRIGTAAAVRQGLNEEKVPALSEIISKAYYTDTIDNALQKFACDTIAAIKRD